MGAIGIRVEKPSEIGPALRKAIEIDSPVIVDVATDIDALAPMAVAAGADRSVQESTGRSLLGFV